MKKKLLFSFLAFPLVFLFACSTSDGAVSVTPNTSSSETHEHDESSESHSDLDVHVHTYVHHDKVDATCEEDGYIEYYTCSECGKYFDADKNEIAGTSIKINALGHDWGNWTVTTSPTHLVPGVETRVCNHDHSHTETRAVPITGHNFDFTEFRWSDNNTKAKAVLVCPDDNEEFLVDASMSHRDTATCTEDGYIEYRAEYNTHWATKNSTFSSRKGHLAAAPVEDLATKKAATCTSDGGYEKVVYCSVCGEELSREIVVNAACGHNWGTEDDWIIDEEPSCNHTGSKHRVCKNDPNDIQYQVIPATGHNFEVTVVPPECETQGYTLHTCTNEDCDYSYKDNYLPALGHRDSHGVIHPSCTNDIPCEYCGAVIEHIGHDYQVDSETSATCEYAGYTHYECANCGDSYNLQTFAPLGHHFDDDHCVDEQDPNYVYSCYHRKKYTCTREACEEHKYEYYVNHTYVYRADLSTEATCQQAGDKVYVCSVCNDVKHVQEGEPNPNNHVWVLGKEIVDGVRTDHCSVLSCSAERQVTVVSGNTNANSLKNKEISVENASSVKFDNSVIDTIANGNDDTEINLTVNEMNKGELGLTLDQLNQIGEKNKVYNFNLTKKVNDDVDTVSNFDGYITITLEYELQPGDDPDNIAVWYIDNNTATLPQDRIKSYQATYSNGYVTFRTNHFSYYAVTTLTNEERCATYGHTWEYTHVDGDCTHGAYDIAVCSVCGSQEISNQEAPLGHDWHETHRTDATCSSSGQIDFECSRCHDTKQEFIPTLGHDWELVEHVDPTCDDNGSDRYVCRTCGQSKVIVINSLGHTFNTEHVDATCEEKGYDHHVCTRCGDSYDDNYDAEEPHHNYVERVISTQSCTESLIIEYRCENDPSHVYYDVTPATGHTPADTAIILNVVPATCTEDGSHDEVIYCTVCGEEISRSHHIDSALGHQEAAMVVENEVEATCEADGHHDEVVYCSTCHEELSRDTVTDAALGHSYGGWVGVSEPTCTEDGEEIRYCEHDHNHTETRPIAATGHTPGEVQIENVDPATCTEAGSHDEVIYCVTPGCEAELSRTHITDEAKGHNWSPWVNMSDHATCTEDRQQSRQCQDCGIIEYRTAEAATGHNLLTRIKEGTETGSTCTEHGHYTLETYCAACGEVFSEYDEVVEKELLPHTPGEMHYDNVVPATCTSNGSHDEVYKCSVCEGEAYRVSGVVDEATGHHFGQWKEVTPATCTSDGLERRTCSDCGLTEDRVIPAHGHDTFEIPYTDPTRSLAPTCTKNGYNYVYDRCRYCEEELNGHTEVVPALGHDYYLDLYLTTFSNDRSTCTMVLVCRNNEEHKVTRTVNTTPDKELSCGVSHDVVTYTAELKYNGKTYTATSQLNNVSLPHTLEEPVIENVVPATCTKDGSYDEVTYCSECGQEVSRIDHSIPRLGHTPGEAVIENDVASTCDEQGHYDEVVYCSVCNAEISRETKYHEYFWHDYSIEQIIKEPTCTEKGVKRVICSHDPSHYNDEEIPALGHKTSMYCTYDENGHFHYCTVCGAEIEGTRQAHDYYTQSKAETCTEDGYSREVCRICGYVSTASYTVIPAKHQSIIYDWIKYNTCTEDGLYNLRCQECGEIIEENIVAPALGHYYKDGSINCYRCLQYDKERVDRTLYIEIPESWGEDHIHIWSAKAGTELEKANRDAFIVGENANGHKVIQYTLPATYDRLRIDNDTLSISTGVLNILDYLDAIECKNLNYMIILDPNDDGDFADMDVSCVTYENQLATRYPHYCDYNYIVNITLTGRTCEEGYHVYKECICGSYYEEDRNYHDTNYVNFPLDSYGYSDKGFYIEDCSICPISNFSSDSVLSQFEESDITHSVTDEAVVVNEIDCLRNVYVINQGETNELTLEVVSYLSGTGCIKDLFELNKLYQGDQLILESSMHFVKSVGEHHLSDPMITYDDPSQGCLGTMHFHQECSECDYTNDYSTSNHSYMTQTYEYYDQYYSHDLLVRIEAQICQFCDVSPVRRSSVMISHGTYHDEHAMTSEEIALYDDTYSNGIDITYPHNSLHIVKLYNSTKLGYGECFFEDDVRLLVYENNVLRLDLVYQEEILHCQFGEWQTTQEPTCTTSGSAVHYCLNDSNNHWNGKELEPLGHDYDENGVCKREGCGHEYHSDDLTVYFEIPADWENVYVYGYKGHEDAYFGTFPGTKFNAEDIITTLDNRRLVKVDVNKNDVEYLIFSNGDKTQTESVNLAYFTEDQLVTLSGVNRERNGYTFLGYEGLNAHYNVHLETEVAHIDIVEPTCTSTGHYTEVVWCKTCHEVYESHEVTVPMVSHTYDRTEDYYIELPTCTEEGKVEHRHYCSICYSVYETEQETVPAKGHTAGEAHEENRVEPTCSKEGGYDEVVRCSDCQVILSSTHHVIEKLAHTPGVVTIENVIEPTYDEVGHHDNVVYCSVCGQELSRETINDEQLVDHDHVTITFIDDYSKALVTVTHDNPKNPEETYYIDVNAVESEHSCEDPYTITYNASYTYKEVVYNADEVVVHKEPIGHSYGGWVTTTEPTCLEGGIETSYCEHDHSHTQIQPISALGHDWGETVYTWNNDNSKVTATRTCKRDGNHVETETVNVTSVMTTEPTCLEGGVRKYTSDSFENPAFSVQSKTVPVDALGHSWGEPYYEWSEDNSAVTAIRRCDNDAAHIETETVSTTSNDTEDPTCVKPGTRVYTSNSFENPAFKVQVKTINTEELDHSWNNPIYTWGEDNSTVTATRTCKRDASHVETETVGVTSSVVTEPTCAENGLREYTSNNFTNPAFVVQSKLVSIPTDDSLHVWGEPVYTWNDNNTKVTATRTCSQNENHIESETVSVTSKVTKYPTCTETGETTYTSKGFKNGAFSTQTKVVTTPAIGHSYETTTINPSCAGQGYIHHECSVCGYSYDDGYFGEATGHIEKYGFNKEGHWLYCSECHISLSETSPHVAGEKEVVPVKEATCTSEGYYNTVISCKDCGYIMSSEPTFTDPIPHTIKESPILTYNSKEDILTASGLCDVCKNNVSENQKPYERKLISEATEEHGPIYELYANFIQFGPNSLQVEINEEPSHTHTLNDGYKINYNSEKNRLVLSGTCKYCNQTIDEDYEIYSRVLQEDANEEHGPIYQLFAHTPYGDLSTIAEVNEQAHEHNYVFEYRVNPTCGKDGYEVWRCSICYATIEKPTNPVTPATGEHVIVSHQYSATLKGMPIIFLDVNTCDKCNNYVANYNYYVNKEYLSSVKEMDIPSEELSKIKEGYSSGKIIMVSGYECYLYILTNEFDCGESCSKEVEEYILLVDAQHEIVFSSTVGRRKVAAHTFGNWEITTSATCSKPGEEKRTCSECDFVETRTINPTGNHTYENGICTVCGNYDPSYFMNSAQTIYIRIPNEWKELMVGYGNSNQGYQMEIDYLTDYVGTVVDNGETYKVYRYVLGVGYDVISFCGDFQYATAPWKISDLANVYGYNSNGYYFTVGVYNEDNHYYDCSIALLTSTLPEGLTAHTHVEGTPEKENETAGDCVTQGGYDLVTRCQDCNHTMLVEHIYGEEPIGHHTFTDVRFNFGEHGMCKGYLDLQYCSVCKAYHFASDSDDIFEHIGCNYHDYSEGNTGSTVYQIDGKTLPAYWIKCPTCGGKIYEVMDSSSSTKENCVEHIRGYLIFEDTSGNIVLKTSMELSHEDHNTSGGQEELFEGFNMEVVRCQDCRKVTRLDVYPEKYGFEGTSTTDDDGVKTTTYTLPGYTILKTLKETPTDQYGCHLIVEERSIIKDSDNKTLYDFTNSYETYRHSYGEETRVGDCEKGYTVTSTCTICGYVQEYKKNGHIEVSRDYIIKNKNGEYLSIKYRVCQECGKVILMDFYNLNQGEYLAINTDAPSTLEVNGITYYLKEYKSSDNEYTVQIGDYKTDMNNERLIRVYKGSTNPVLDLDLRFTE